MVGAAIYVIDDNSYVELPAHLGISRTFNVNDLYIYPPLEPNSGSNSFHEGEIYVARDYLMENTICQLDCCRLAVIRILDQLEL